MYVKPNFTLETGYLFDENLKKKLPEATHLLNLDRNDVRKCF